MNILRVFFFAINVACALPAQYPVTVTADALVCDREGIPLVGVELGTTANLVNGTLLMKLPGNTSGGDTCLTTDSSGRVRGKWGAMPAPGWQLSLLAVSRDRKLAAFVYPYPEVGLRFYAITKKIILGPAVKLRFEVAAPLVPRERVEFSLSLTHSYSRLSSGLSPYDVKAAFTIKLDGPEVEIPIPANRYALILRSGRGRSTLARTVVLHEERPIFEFGTIHPRYFPLELLGEVLPDWHIDCTRNISLEFSQLADLRGKPLLVHFLRVSPWKNREEGLARLATHPRRDQFRVVLFNSWYEHSIPGIPNPKPREIRTTWPVLTDKTGETSNMYGLGESTTILLDRDGKLLVCGKTEAVVKALEDHLKSSSRTQRR